jgi:hypothetical protein
VKALAITLAAGAALWAGSVPLQAKLAAIASDLAPRAKRALGSAVGIAAGGGPMTYRPRAYYGSGAACPAMGLAGSAMDLPGTRTATAQASAAGSGERSNSRRNRKPPFRRGRLRSAQ